MYDVFVMDHRSPEHVDMVRQIRKRLGLDDPDNLALYLVQLFEGDKDVHKLVLSRMTDDDPMGLDGEKSTETPGELDLWDEDSNFEVEERGLGASISHSELLAVGHIPVPKVRKVTKDPEVEDFESFLNGVLEES